MTDGDAVLVLGDAVRPFGRTRDGSTPRDWVRKIAWAALEDAQVAPEDIDAVVIGSESDHLSLQLSAGALMLDEIGLAGRSVMRVEMGGATGAAAVRAGAMQIAARAARFVLVIGFEHGASHLAPDDVRLLYGLSFDADLEGMAGVQAVHLYALSIVEHMHRFGTTERDLAAIAVKNRRNAALNPIAHRRKLVSMDDVLASPPVSTPYKTYDCSPLSDGAAAIVLGAAAISLRSARRRVAIAGMGSASDAVRLGDRAAPWEFAAKRRASEAAYAQARIRNPRDEIGLAEVYDAFSGAELQALEALGLANEGEAATLMGAGIFVADGRLPVNLSGGLIGQGGAPGATGVAQIATLTRLLQGRYWPDLQPRQIPRFALADAHSGVGTVSIVHVLEGAP
ncbi:MAG: thiolase family protein [Alphaproteobacteria bacterium]|nr:thiolase family protein [Alphaproteobacteria bacterium]